MRGRVSLGSRLDSDSHGGEGMVAGVGGRWSHCACSQEAKRDECWSSYGFSFSSQYKVPNME